MTTLNASDLELFKENVLPLKTGRDAAGTTFFFFRKGSTPETRFLARACPLCQLHPVALSDCVLCGSILNFSVPQHLQRLVCQRGLGASSLRPSR
jgi:hypothetical protein